MFAGAAGLFLLGYYWGQRYRTPERLRTQAAVQLTPAIDLPEFRATDAAGLDFASARLRGHWSLLVVEGENQDSTNLPTRVYNRLADHPGLQQSLQLVRVRLTPPAPGPAERPPFTSVFGKRDELSALLQALGDGATATSAGSLFLLDPQARAVALFTPDRLPATIAADIVSLTDSGPGR
jgi:hypothetical protein